jgi:FimV-like protein
MTEIPNVFRKWGDEDILEATLNALANVPQTDTSELRKRPRQLFIKDEDVDEETRVINNLGRNIATEYGFSPEEIQNIQTRNPNVLSNLAYATLSNMLGENVPAGVNLSEVRTGERPPGAQSEIYLRDIIRRFPDTWDKAMIYTSAQEPVRSAIERITAAEEPELDLSGASAGVSVGLRGGGGTRPEEIDLSQRTQQVLNEDMDEQDDLAMAKELIKAGNQEGAAKILNQLISSSNPNIQSQATNLLIQIQ